MQLASDLDNTDFVNPKNPDSIMSVEFYDYAAPDMWKTKETGIKHFKPECPFIRLAVPGMDKSIVERPAEQADARRFPQHWLHYQMTTGKIAMAGDVPGWKLGDWDIVNAEQVRNLNHLRFYTVEQIAGASDMQIQGMGIGGQGLKNQAIAALEARHAERSNVEIAKRDQQIETQGKQLEEQGKQIAEMRAMFEQLVKKK